jgi:Ca2+-binding RTX toxin-like protein
MANINGTEANDTLTGTSSNDIIKGGGGADTINAGGGNDLILGGAGADAINGGTGIDTASYEDSSSAVTISLLGGFGSGGTAQGDTLTSIENVTGSSFNDLLIGDHGANTIEGGGGDDIVAGNGGNDVLRGGAGNDTVYGGMGADTMDGGTGIDTLSYATSAAGVWVSLDNGAAFYGDAQGDAFTNFENLVGSFHDDRLTGDSGANVITGGGGNDILVGDSYFPTVTGADTFVYETTSFGNDVIGDFRHGEDRIQFDQDIFANFAAVQTHMSQVGADTVITLNANNSITLYGVNAASLGASDFVFV